MGHREEQLARFSPSRRAPIIRPSDSESSPRRVQLKEALDLIFADDRLDASPFPRTLDRDDSLFELSADETLAEADELELALSDLCY